MTFDFPPLYTARRKKVKTVVAENLMWSSYSARVGICGRGEVVVENRVVVESCGPTRLLGRRCARPFDVISVG